MNSIFVVLLLSFVLCTTNCFLLKPKVAASHHFLLSSSVFPVSKLQQQSADTSCNENQFDKCTKDLAMALNVNFTASAFDFLFAEIKYLFDNGLSGFEKFCGGIRGYINCIGSEYFDVCLSVDNLINQGLSETDAAVYATVAQQLRYECGPAFDIFVGHYKCIDVTARTKGWDLIYCVENYNASIFRNQTEYCKSTQDFVYCYVNVYDECGADMKAVLCQTMVAGYKVTFPDCTLSCHPEEATFSSNKLVVKQKYKIEK